MQADPCVSSNVPSLGSRSSDNRMRAISQTILQPWITKITIKITYLKFLSYLPGVNELITRTHKRTNTNTHSMQATFLIAWHWHALCYKWDDVIYFITQNILYIGHHRTHHPQIHKLTEYCLRSLPSVLYSHLPHAIIQRYGRTWILRSR